MGKHHLHIAVKNDIPDLILVLLKAGADINAKDNKGWTPIYYVIKSSPSTLNLLIEAKANVNVQDNEGISPLRHYAKIAAYKHCGIIA